MKMSGRRRTATIHERSQLDHSTGQKEPASNEIRRKPNRVRIRLLLTSLRKAVFTWAVTTAAQRGYK
jgi:hypothetical protein